MADTNAKLCKNPTIKSVAARALISSPDTGFILFVTHTTMHTIELVPKMRTIIQNKQAMEIP